MVDEFLKRVKDGSVRGVSLREFGLKGRGEIFLEGKFCLRWIVRKSRFLMKDAVAFYEVLTEVSRLKEQSLMGLVWVEGAPVCSKAQAWLDERGIQIERS